MRIEAVLLLLLMVIVVVVVTTNYPFRSTLMMILLFTDNAVHGVRYDNTLVGTPLPTSVISFIIRSDLLLSIRKPLLKMNGTTIK